MESGIGTFHTVKVRLRDIEGETQNTTFGHRYVLLPSPRLCHPSRAWDHNHCCRCHFIIMIIFIVSVARFVLIMAIIRVIYIIVILTMMLTNSSGNSGRICFSQLLIL